MDITDNINETGNDGVTEDNYELMCQPTDDDTNDVRDNVLIPEIKGNKVVNAKSINYSDFFNSIFFQILIAIFGVYLLYYAWKFIIAKITSKSVKVGGGINKRK